eukprot:2232905-Prymnesium_polylepis.1
MPMVSLAVLVFAFDAFTGFAARWRSPAALGPPAFPRRSALSKPAATMEGYVYFPLACAAAGDALLTGSNGFDGEGCELRLWDRRMLRQVLEMRGHRQA